MPMNFGVVVVEACLVCKHAFHISVVANSHCVELMSFRGSRILVLGIGEVELEVH